MDGTIKSDTAKLRADIDSPETAAKLQQYDDLQVMRDNVNIYAEQIKVSGQAYKSLPLLSRDYYDAIDESLETVMNENEGTKEPAEVAAISYANGSFTFNIEITSEDELSHKYPAALVQYIYDNHSDLFAKVSYGGYSVSTTKADASVPGSKDSKKITFNLELQINNETQLPNLKEETAEAAEEETAE
jgi:hypothetical protein